MFRTKCLHAEITIKSIVNSTSKHIIPFL